MFSLGTNVTMFVFFFSAAHLLFRFHLDSFYLVSQMKISHEISSVINKTHQTVDLYFFLLYEYSNILIKTFLNIKLKRPTPSPQSLKNVFNHSLVFPVFQGLSGISGLFGK